MSTNAQLVKVLGALALLGMITSAFPAKDPKLTPAELVAKHLESIGPPEARAHAGGMQIKGTSLLSVRQGGRGQIEGQTLMASQGIKNMIDMTFASSEYPQELLKFDGKEFTASQFRPGMRTSLAQFFMSNDVLFKEGLFGGVLSASWPMLNLSDKNPKLEYAGLKKVGGKQLHALKYMPRKGADLKITLFFDAETFQHIRTEYERTIYPIDQQRIPATGQVSAPSTQRSSNARINAFEEFSEFRPESGLKLPHTYKFELSIQSEVRPALIDWTFNLTDFTFGGVSEFK